MVGWWVGIANASFLKNKYENVHEMKNNLIRPYYKLLIYQILSNHKKDIQIS
jgi:hypothetical protein